MPSRVIAEGVVADTDKALKVWKANPAMTIVNLTPAEVEAARDSVQTLETTIEDLRDQLTGLLDRRNDQAKALNKLVVRVRGAIKSNFGDDSPEYEQAGGTRGSESRSRLKKPELPDSLPPTSEATPPRRFYFAVPQLPACRNLAILSPHLCWRKATMTARLINGENKIEVNGVGHWYRIAGAGQPQLRW